MEGECGFAVCARPTCVPCWDWRACWKSRALWVRVVGVPENMTEREQIAFLHRNRWFNLFAMYDMLHYSLRKKRLQAVCVRWYHLLRSLHLIKALLREVREERNHVLIHVGGWRCRSQQSQSQAPLTAGHPVGSMVPPAACAGRRHWGQRQDGQWDTWVRHFGFAEVFVPSLKSEVTAPVLEGAKGSLIFVFAR